MRRILCATDFLPKSEPAMDRAGSLAQQFDADLSLLHVVSPISTERAFEESLQIAIGEAAGVPLRYHPGYTGTTVAFVPGAGVAVVVATNRLVTAGEPASHDVLRGIALDAVADLLREHVTPDRASDDSMGRP